MSTIDKRILALNLKERLCDMVYEIIIDRLSTGVEKLIYNIFKWWWIGNNIDYKNGSTIDSLQSCQLPNYVVNNLAWHGFVTIRSGK